MNLLIFFLGDSQIWRHKESPLLSYPLARLILLLVTKPHLVFGVWRYYDVIYPNLLLSFRCLISTVPLSCLLCYQHTVKRECPSSWPPDCPAIHACAKSIPFDCEVKNELNGLCKLGYLYAENLPQEDKNILLINCLDV